ncbi:hypothetical protein ACSBR2_029217 [Camellia fascicularis]
MGTFHFPVGESTVTLQDIALLFNLPINGDAVTGKDPGNKVDNLIALCVELLGAAPTQQDFIGSSLKLKWISDHFCQLPHDATDETVHHYTREMLCRATKPDTKEMAGPIVLLQYRFRHGRDWAGSPPIGRLTWLMAIVPQGRETSSYHLVQELASGGFHSTTR